MNYMAKVAKMLDVEMGEEFTTDYPGHVFRITNGGFEVFRAGSWVCDTTASFVLHMLLNGEYSIKRKPWKPNEDEIFWHIDAFGNPVLDRWTGHSYHLMLYKLGNCYHTEVDAKKDRDKWADFYASDEVLEV